MSFILDALKKSEADRQQQTGAEFSDVPSSSGDPQSMKWLWILAVILLVNLAVLLGILLRPGPEPVTPSAAQPETAEQQVAAPEPAAEPTAEPAVEPSFEERIEEAKSNQPTEAVVAEEPPASDVAPAAVAASPEPDRPYLKTIDELRLDGVLQLPELHIDIHVYAEEPTERFVFINMNKLTENARLPEGPVVKEIRTDGVVLEHQGLTFLLPRE